MSIFTEVLSKSGLPEPSQQMIEGKLVEALNLIVLNNNRVAQVNAAKAQDPTNVEYLDERWKSNAATDPEISDEAERFYAVAEEYEKLLKSLREKGKKHIPEVLSDEKTAELKKLVNDAGPTIEKAVEGAKSLAALADQMLELSGEKVEGGLIGMLPGVESLKSTRGRKAATGEISYMTRVAEILLDGKSTNKEINGKSRGKFNFAADILSKRFGSEIVASNAVTAEELEEAYWAKIGAELRSKKQGELPTSLEFEFTKTVKVKNTNDDGFTDVPQTVVVKVIQPLPETPKTETPTTNAETAKPETAEPVKPETAEPVKVESKVVTQVPAKKTANSNTATQAKK